MGRICIAMLACVASALSAGAVDDGEDSKGFAFDDKVVLAYYYIWFDEDDWLKPLGNGGRREQLEGLHPLVGAYNSWDPAIIEKHMQQMNRALIDALAVSWWYAPGSRDKNETLDTIFEKAVAHNLKVTVDYEHGRAPLDEIDHDLRYFLERYKDHPAMLKVEGSPVVMVWTAWGHTPEEWRGVFDKLKADGFDTFPILSGSYEGGKGKRFLGPFRSLEEYTLVDVEDSGLADYMKTMRGYIDAYNETEGKKTGILAQHHATISPGYDETKNAGRKTINGGYLGAGWKDRTKFGVTYPDDPEGAYYRGTFEAAMASDPDWLHISTFNELAEFSHIEATYEHGYTYLDLTAEFVRKFKGLEPPKAP
ncbi:MAG: hypothetical protein GC168_21650 [Candidatus Hydrogenedens sp.]|nr:hypothetical protein [Candidatus Hydrogenedens sp.]